MNDAQVMLQVLKGSFGANKTYWVSRPSRKGIILFFPGDQLEDALAPPEIRRLQDPKVQAQLMASKFGGCSSVVVMPSRLEGSFACFDHFLNRITRSGEPLSYRGALLKASSQIASLLQAGCPTDDNKEMVYHLVGFSKDDEKRPWVRQEKVQFQALLERNGVIVVERKYFAEGKPTLLMHFEAIEAMQRGA
ncbi:TPA: hypothetical protein ACH3X2_005722 [Trebouxia sp. C0005]